MARKCVFWDWDLAADRVTWADASDGVFGWTAPRGDRTSWWWHERIHPCERERVRAGLQAVIDGGGLHWSARFRVLTRAGTYALALDRAVVVRSEGRAVRVVGALSLAGDVFPSNRAAAGACDAHVSPLARLQQSEKQLRVFVESLPLLVWTATADGWVDFYNRSWYEYTGTTYEQMQGWGWAAVHDPYALPRMLRVWRNALATGQPWEDEFRLRRASDGMLRWHLSRAMPLHDEQGRVLRWFGTNTDIHDQKLALEERSRLLVRERAARRRVEAASRAKDEFLAVVSHELRTPLNAILGWVQLLRTDALEPARQQTAIEKIEKNARLQAKLVEDLLDVARIVGDKLQVVLEPLDATVAVQASVEALRPAAEERGIALDLVCDRDCDSGADRPAWVCGNAERLQQIVSNLLGNAIKFSQPGQRVEVRLVGGVEEVRIEVRDQGKGIPATFLPQLFQRFRQVDSSSTRQHGGLGLGLSIVRHLVEAHRGHVIASSEGEGRGATFCVILPALSRDQGAARQAAGAAPGEPPAMRSLAGIRVLGVDDDSGARDILAEILLACGATVTMAGSVHEALRYFKVERPDVIVSDIAMPGVDGYGLVDRVRALPDPVAAGTPIIAFTAYASTEDRQRALDAGFDHHLAKPLDAVQLSHLISEIVMARTLSREQGR